MAVLVLLLGFFEKYFSDIFSAICHISVCFFERSCDFFVCLIKGLTGPIKKLKTIFTIINVSNQWCFGPKKKSLKFPDCPDLNFIFCIDQKTTLYISDLYIEKKQTFNDEWERWGENGEKTFGLWNVDGWCVCVFGIKGQTFYMVFFLTEISLLLDPINMIDEWNEWTKPGNVAKKKPFDHHLCLIY